MGRGPEGTRSSGSIGKSERAQLPDVALMATQAPPHRPSRSERGKREVLFVEAVVFVGRGRADCGPVAGSHHPMARCALTSLSTRMCHLKSPHCPQIRTSVTWQGHPSVTIYSVLNICYDRGSMSDTAPSSRPARLRNRLCCFSCALFLSPMLSSQLSPYKNHSSTSMPYFEFERLWPGINHRSGTRRDSIDLGNTTIM